jgi:hypothetical protein
MNTISFLDNCQSAVSTGLEIEKISKCIGDPEADKENPVLKAEQDAQVR